MDNLPQDEIELIQNDCTRVYAAFPNGKKPTLRDHKNAWFKARSSPDASDDHHQQQTTALIQSRKVNPARSSQPECMLLNGAGPSPSTNAPPWNLKATGIIDTKRDENSRGATTHTHSVSSGGDDAGLKTSGALFDPKKLIMSLAAEGNSTALKIFWEDRHEFAIKPEIIPYTRPTILNERQNEIIDKGVIGNIKIIMLEGDRRTGKSTAWFEIVKENIYEGRRTKWGLWAATAESCSKIHRDAVNDKVFWKWTEPIIMSHTATRTRFRMNGGLLETHATKMTDASGLQYEGIIIDEFHQVLKDNPEAFATIAGITRSEADLLIILVCNRGTGAYEAFKDALQPLIKKGKACFYTLEKDDTTHITEEANEVADILMRASMGDDFADRQLKNEQSWEGDAFTPQMIIDSMNSYDDFIEGLGKNTYHAVIGVDPGFAHPTGIIVMGVFRGHIFELESMLMRGKDTSDERIKAVVAELAHDYQTTDIFCESNSGGLHWIKAWNEEYGLSAVSQNFHGTESHPFHRKNMIKGIRDLMLSHRVHFCNKDLKFQLLKYDPEKDKNDSKGDLADAFIHASYALINNLISDDETQVAWG